MCSSPEMVAITKSQPTVSQDSIVTQQEQRAESTNTSLHDIEHNINDTIQKNYVKDKQNDDQMLGQNDVLLEISNELAASQAKICETAQQTTCIPHIDTHIITPCDTINESVSEQPSLLEQVEVAVEATDERPSLSDSNVPDEEHSAESESFKEEAMEAFVSKRSEKHFSEHKIQNEPFSETNASENSKQSPTHKFGNNATNVKLEADQSHFNESNVHSLEKVPSDPNLNEKGSVIKASLTKAGMMSFNEEDESFQAESEESDEGISTSPLVSPPMSQDTDAVSLENFEPEDLEEEHCASFSHASDGSASQSNGMEANVTVSAPFVGGMAPNFVAMSAPTPIRPLHGDPRYAPYHSRPVDNESKVQQHFQEQATAYTTAMPSNQFNSDTIHGMQSNKLSNSNLGMGRMFENQTNAPSFYNPTQDAAPFLPSQFNQSANPPTENYDTAGSPAQMSPPVSQCDPSGNYQAISSQPRIQPSVPHPQNPNRVSENPVQPFLFAPCSLTPRKINDCVYQFPNQRALSRLIQISKHITTPSQTAALAVDMLRGVLMRPAQSLAWCQPEVIDEYQVLLHKGSIGLCMNMNICMSRVTVTSFRNPAEGIVGPAEASGKIEIGDELVAVDGYRIVKAEDFTQVVGRLKSLRPVLLRFRRPNWVNTAQNNEDGRINPLRQGTSVAGLDNPKLFTQGIWHMGVRYIRPNEWAVELHVDGSGVRRLGVYMSEREAAMIYNRYIHHAYGSTVMGYMHPAGTLTAHSENVNDPAMFRDMKQMQRQPMLKKSRVRAAFTADQKEQLRAQIMVFKFTASDGTIPNGILSKALRSNAHKHLAQDPMEQRKRKRKFAPEPIIQKSIKRRGRKGNFALKARFRKKKRSDTEEESEIDEAFPGARHSEQRAMRRSNRNVGKARKNYAEKESEPDFGLSDDEKRKKRAQTTKMQGIDEEESRKGPLIDKIIAVRFVKDTLETVMEFLIKWKDTSYLHTDWLSVHDIEAFGHHAITRMRRYLKKHTRQVEVSRENPVLAGKKDSTIYFSESYVEVDRILDCKETEEPMESSPFRLFKAAALTQTQLQQTEPPFQLKKGNKYLVKWRDLSYADCTWEWEDTLTDDRKIAAYHRFNHPPIVNGANPAMFSDIRPDPSAWAKYQESPVYNNQNQLRPYQLEGLNWMVFCWYNRRNCILADEMGLGKTIQATSILEHLRQREHIRGPFLVIAPLATLGNWKREIETWTSMNCVLYHNSEGGSDIRAFIREQEFYYKQSDMYRRRGVYKFNVLVTSYQTLIADAEFLECIHWRYLVVDEAHKLKNREAKLLQTMQQFTWDACLLMTGTPLQNGVYELWCLLNFIEPEKFPSQQQFYDEYGDLATADQVARLHEQLRPFMLRRVKEDVEKTIPPKEETIIDVELTTLQKKYYRAIFERNRAFLNQGTSGSVANLVNVEMELRKCCNHPFLIRGVEEKECLALDEAQRSKILVQASGKTVLLDKMLTKFKSENKKILIFSQFKMMLDVIEDLCHLRNYQIERMDGSVRGNSRQAAIDRFNSPNSDTFAFLLSTRAGGVGINLIAASVVILYDSDWNPQNDLQAVARCHRIGQTKSVNIYRLVTKKTYEAQMFDIASKKLGMHHAVFETGGVRNEFDGEDESGSGNMMSLMSLDREKVEMMIRYGAYAIMGEEDEQDPENRAINELDIDQLLSASRTIRYDPTRGDSVEEKEGSDIKVSDKVNGNTALSFSKATFTAEMSDSTIDFNDEQFWEKVLGPKPVQVLMNKVQEGWLRTASTDEIKAFLNELRVCARAVVHERQRGGASTDTDPIMSILIELKVTGPIKKGIVNVRQVAAEWLETIERPKRRRNQDVESELMYLEFIDGAKDTADGKGNAHWRQTPKNPKARKAQEELDDDAADHEYQFEEEEESSENEEEEEDGRRRHSKKRKRPRPTSPSTNITVSDPAVLDLHKRKSDIRISLRVIEGALVLHSVHSKKTRVEKLLQCNVHRKRSESESKSKRSESAEAKKSLKSDAKLKGKKRKKKEAKEAMDTGEETINAATETLKPALGMRKKLFQQHRMALKDKVDPQEDEEMWCRVCFSDQGFLDDPIVQCERCEVAVHKYCYGIEAVPEGDIPWYCDYCADASTEGKQAKSQQCLLCPLTRPISAFKKTIENDWAHVVCALWAPGSQFQHPERMQGILNARQAMKDMQDTKCVVCDRNGGCIQCMKPLCPVLFHPICAHETKGEFDLFMNENGLLRAFCPKHNRQKKP